MKNTEAEVLQSEIASVAYFEQDKNVLKHRVAYLEVQIRSVTKTVMEVAQVTPGPQ